MLSVLLLPFVASAVLGSSLSGPWHHARHYKRDADPPSVNSTNSTVEMVSAAYFAAWHAENFTLEDVNWDKFTHMIYAFGVTDPANPHAVVLTEDDDTLLTQFVNKSRSNDVKAMLSIGGWTGGRTFSSNVASKENRTEFIKSVIDVQKKYQLDGIDFDWEYPNNQGIGCNEISPNDTSNFLTFLQELRQQPEAKDLIITAATPISPWKDADGNASTDVSGFADVLDFITIMNYDINGHWSDYVAANAPLNDTCAGDHAAGSAVSAVAAWTAAGMPSSKIVLGVASYGHSFTVAPEDALNCSDDNSVIAEFPSFNKDSYPLGDAWDAANETDVCGVVNPAGGNWDFWALIKEGWLNENGTVAEGIDYRFDECSQTPYVYNEEKQIMVAFDDAKSFAAKGEFIKSQNLRGFNMWEAGGDYKDILLDSISAAAGFTDDGDDDDDEDDENC